MNKLGIIFFLPLISACLGPQGSIDNDDTNIHADFAFEKREKDYLIKYGFYYDDISIFNYEKIVFGCTYGIKIYDQSLTADSVTNLYDVKDYSLSNYILEPFKPKNFISVSFDEIPKNQQCLTAWIGFGLGSNGAFDFMISKTFDLKL